MRVLTSALALGVLCMYASPLHAQGTGGGTPPVTHQVAFASTGNVLEIAVVNRADVRLPEALSVVVTGAPTWLTFSSPAADLEGVEPDEEATVALAFDVARDAPVGVPSEIVVEVRAGVSAVLQTKTVRLEVVPPHELALHAPRPNPVRGAAAIPFELPAPSRVVVEVLDVLGRRVAVLVEGEREAGAHVARLEAGRLAAGAYVVRLLVEGERPGARVTRLTVVR